MSRKSGTDMLKGYSYIITTVHCHFFPVASSLYCLLSLKLTACTCSHSYPSFGTCSFWWAALAEQLGFQWVWCSVAVDVADIEEAVAGTEVGGAGTEEGRAGFGSGAGAEGAAAVGGVAGIADDELLVHYDDG